ncbi:centrosomal protein 97kDa isoform X2 [Arctopsyche grandis]|uniref:centrosomal protein 97kDa isoform X2 n=1 Tax=Arctopsyche grandis TaxID=121162 RepID=UPI00406D7F39
MAEESCETLDCSGKSIKKIIKATEQEAKTLVTLILDNNELQRLDCVDSYSRLENLSVAKNSLLRMHGVGRLTSLRQLNLSHNSILTIEGLKELIYLKKLQLAGNNIKSIEHLNNNIHLEYLDLSDNQISHISDISCLKHLKHLHLEKNRIGNLRQCERYLPSSLLVLGLANNFLTDLNTLCHLGHLGNLESYNIEGNPCVTVNGHEKIDFDYRPFVINWLMNVKMLDGYEVNAIESLKAEWLYSQGRGRQFREGEHAQLIQYLATTCPLGAAAPETEEQRKLRLILSKAQHHQQQLREQGPTPPRPKQSPRMHPRITGRVTKSPDRAMSSSYHSALPNKHHILLNQQSGSMSASFSGEIPTNSTPTKTQLNRSIADSTYSSAMSQSFDSSSSSLVFNSDAEKSQNTAKVVENSKVVEKPVAVAVVENSPQLDSNKAFNQPLEAASKMVPVPDSMMSPDYQGPLFAPQLINSVNKRNVNSGLSYQPNSRHLQSNETPNSHCESPLSARSSKMPVHTKTSTTVHIAKPTMNQSVKNNKGSPQLPRSAMSSPKMRHCTDQRKGSFSSRIVQNNTEEANPQMSKHIYNQGLQNAVDAGGSGHAKSNDMSAKKHNGSNKTIQSLTNHTEIQVTPPDTQEANSSDEDSEMCIEKLQCIRDAANQRRKKQSISDSGSSENVASTLNKSSKGKSAHCAAITIQKLWRGYRTRNLNQKAGSIMHSIQTMRARQYIEKLSCDMEATKAALDSERKIQQLQMQAINALWKKISAIEADCRGKGDGKVDSCKNLLSLTENLEKSDDTDDKDLAVRELTQTCSMLQSQVCVMKYIQL